MKKEKPVRRMCINCAITEINGKGLFCVLIPGFPVKIDDIRYSCPEHKLHSESRRPAQ